MAKRSFYQNFEADEGVKKHCFIPSWERFDFLLTKSYKLNDSHSSSIIGGLKLDSDVYKFEPCVAIVDEKACGQLPCPNHHHHQHLLLFSVPKK
ncbi:hypothetical protein KQX54_002815 [Cotesia glomerata]|uniref:Uncharacterized protein n=1 Tax=Cotesia glomerata TaxID=32391 RepID=A0AAV7HG90_COTGL|nr:hypothetical protein KQX54_002815 [Cotesia glomerata]